MFTHKNNAWQQGHSAAQDGKSKAYNPYLLHAEMMDWNDGWEHYHERMGRSVNDAMNELVYFTDN